MAAKLKFSILSLNVKGLRNNIKRNKIYHWIKENNGSNSIIFLQESHSDRKSEKLWKSQWNGEILFSHGTTHSCGVMTLIGSNVEFF